MRIRTIKPDFFHDEEMADRPPLERLLFLALWLLADRAGRLEDRPQKIKALALPFDTCDVDAMLADLDACGFIQRYEANGRRYIWVRSFEKHQRPNSHEPQSVLPAPPGPRPGRARKKHTEPIPDNTRRGFIYFIRAEGGPVKIGFSQNPSARINDLRCGSPANFVLLGSIPGTMRQETEWHQRFAALRIDREWFSPADELLNAIAEATKTTEMHASREGKGKEGKGKRAGELERLLAEPEIRALSELWVQELGSSGERITLGVARAAQRFFAAGYSADIAAAAVLGIKAARDPVARESYPPRCLARWAAEHNDKPGFVLRPEKVEEIAADYRRYGGGRRAQSENPTGSEESPKARAEREAREERAASLATDAQ